MRVMVIDDSRTMRGIMRQVLETLGCAAVEEAIDGQDALSKVKAFRPELILLDWNMPNMDGLEFLRRFRAGDRETPVIMVTTESSRERVVEAIRAGVDDYVLKPFTAEELAQRIREALNRDRAA